MLYFVPNLLFKLNMTTQNGFIRLCCIRNAASQTLNFFSTSSVPKRLTFSIRDENKDQKIRISNNFRHSNCLRSGNEPISSDENSRSIDITNYSMTRHTVSEDLMEQERIRLNTSGKVSQVSRRLKKFNIQGEIIYGVHPVYLALLSRRRQLFELYVYKRLPRLLDSMKGRIYQQALDLGIPIREVNRNVLLKISEGHVNQGVCLDASRLNMVDIEKSSVGNTSAKNSSFCLLLDRIQDPMNFGAVLRSSYYFGVDEVFAVKESSCKLSPVVSKASSGAMEVLPVYSVNDLEAFLQSKKEEGWMIVGSDAHISHEQKHVDIYELDISRPTIFILGNEGTGMSKCIYDFLDAVVTIKPKKKLEHNIGSLNVSVVCGIVLHQLLGRCSS